MRGCVRGGVRVGWGGGCVRGREFEHLAGLPSAVRRSRLQPPQKGEVIDETKETCPCAPGSRQLVATSCRSVAMGCRSGYASRSRPMASLKGTSLVRVRVRVRVRVKGEG